MRELAEVIHRRKTLTKSQRPRRAAKFITSILAQILKAPEKPIDEHHRHASFPIVAFFIILIAPFFQPDTVSVWGIPYASDIYFYGRILSGFVALALFLSSSQWDIFSLLAIALAAVMLLSCIANNGDLRIWFNNWAVIAAITLLVAYGVKSHLKEMLWAVVIVATALSLIDIASFFLFPDGIYGPKETRLDHFFFGHRNAAFNLIFASTGSSLLIDALMGKRVSWRTILLTGMGLFQLLWNYSATSCVALLLSILLVALCQWRLPRRLVNGLTAAIYGLGSFLVLVVFRVQDVFSPFITQVLNRTVTFTGRTYVWDKAIELVTNDPLHAFLGYGPMSNAANLLNSNGWTYYHTHNEVLWLLFTGGLVALALAGFAFALIVSSLYRDRKSYPVTILVAILIGLMTILLMEISEGFCVPYFLALSYYLPRSMIFHRPSFSHPQPSAIRR